MASIVSEIKHAAEEGHRRRGAATAWPPACRSVVCFCFVL